MKTLIKKEIRLLLPAWITAMLLAVVPGILNVAWVSSLPGAEVPHAVSPYFFVQLIFAAGVLFLGINSFGEEMSCNTFSALLSQPMKRSRIWLVKIGTLATAFISVWLAGVLFALWQIHLVDGWFHIYELGDAFEFLTLAALVAFSGGLWTTLLLRQTATAFWITLLMPLAIISGISIVLQEWIARGHSINTPVVVALVLYSIAGFFVAWRLFMHAQDIQWTGGEVSLPFGKGAAKAKTGAEIDVGSWRRGTHLRSEATGGQVAALPVRTRHWFSTLAWKELQLHQGTFLIAAIVLVLHLSAVFIRKFNPHIQNSDLEFFLANFWMVWLLMPLLIGAAAIAEERRMGTLEPQLSLPVPRSAQLFFKLSIGLLLGLFFGALIPVLIERYICGAGVSDSGLWVIAEREMMNSIDTYNQWHWVVVLAGAIYFVSFYASSLGRTAFQGIGLAIPVALVIYLYEIATGYRPGLEFYFSPHTGIAILNRYLGVPILVIVLGGLTLSNFKYIHQNRRFWLRNVAAILAVFICVPFLARAVYYRPWEIFLPLEPRGPVRIQDPSEVKFMATHGDICAISPTGHLWVAPYTFGIPKINTGRGQLVGGSNWVDFAVNEFEALAVQSDGTLWSLRGETGSTTKTQIGTENDWSHVAGGTDGFLILKKDGSLWDWGILPSNWGSKSNPNPSIAQKLQRDFSSIPVRVSDNTNWTALYSTHLFSPCARNKNGTLWLLAGKHLKQETNVDDKWLSLQFDDGLSYVEVQTNGDLCYLDGMMFIRQMMTQQHTRRPRFLGRGSPEKLGEPWKWTTATFGPIDGYRTVMAIRNDGTLWKFSVQPPQLIKGQSVFVFVGQPVQLGSRSDWVAVSQGFSLASDGSIWTWNEHSDYNWLAPSRRPVYMGNIFEASGDENQAARNTTQ